MLEIMKTWLGVLSENLQETYGLIWGLSLLRALSRATRRGWAVHFNNGICASLVFRKGDEVYSVDLTERTGPPDAPLELQGLLPQVSFPTEEEWLRESEELSRDVKAFLQLDKEREEERLFLWEEKERARVAADVAAEWVRKRARERAHSSLKKAGMGHLVWPVPR